MDVFESLKKSGAELNSVVYNTVLDVRDTQLPAIFFFGKKELITKSDNNYNTRGAKGP